ncbi:hypothetical protein [Paracoccus lutimaris]|uniref:Polyketide cyclase/dehydrase/lipid transport protein n=1 Tax=Paracoccus lutimaris TaxID=1490030 RepID=A0A368ZAB5_9RHOB|nr:hypothetical protein [Paracoccus lutimaris]RCW88718.1 hypothetical protein DFP89_101153 [Paracoccus lutimaris]
MKFSTRHEADIPAATLFRTISNFDVMERSLSRKGASVRRLDSLSEPGTGMNWRIDFDWRGRRREIALELTRHDPPETLELQGQSEHFDLTIRMTVVALSPVRSRLIFETDILPRGMKARLLLQTAKLGKPQLDRKFDRRIAEFVDQLVAAQTV